MTAHQFHVTLLKKLLVHCLRWASRSLKGLLYFSFRLSQLFDMRKAEDGPSSKKAGSSLRLSDHESDRAASPCISAQKDPVESAGGGAIVISCSSIPTVPRQERSHARFTSVDSLDPMSPTIYSEPGPLSESGYETGHNPPASLHTIEEASTVAPERILAEPAGVTANPKAILFTPMTTAGIPRYDRNVEIENYCGPWSLEPLATFAIVNPSFHHLTPWQYRVHPEGQPYYICKQGQFCYLTEADASDLEIRARLGRFMDAFEEKASQPKFTKRIPPNVEVALEPQDDDECLYYMIDLHQQAIFWLDTYNFEIQEPDQGVEGEHHLRHKLTFEYWRHIEMFPLSMRQPPKKYFDEALDFLNYCNIDSITSVDSTAPYGNIDLQAMIASVRHLKSASDARSSAFAIVGLARLMGVIQHDRHVNFHGFKGARLSAFQSVRGNTSYEHSWLVRCLSPLFFYAPDTYLKKIEKIYVDDVMRQERWRRFQAKLENDWNEYVLYATVLLNANVAFLTIPNVNSDNRSVYWSSPAAAASLVSTIASLASIIIGLLLVRQLRIGSNGEEGTTSDAITYLERRKHKQLGRESIAIQFSLPYALLMWGMLSFSLAIAIVCFFQVDTTPSFATRMIYTVVWVLMAPLILWSVLTGWEVKTKLSWRELPVISPGWWKGLIKNTPTLLRLRKKRPSSPEDGFAMSETSTANDHESEPSTEIDKRPVRVRFGPVRQLTRSVVRRFSRSH